MDNSPHSYIFQPENALPIGTFIDDPQDQVRRASMGWWAGACRVGARKEGPNCGAGAGDLQGGSEVLFC